MTENNDVKYKALFKDLARTLPPITEPQDYPGLDAGGYLLVALGHLVKAREKLDEEPPSEEVYLARRDAIYAINLIRDALKLLDEQKTQGAS